MGGYFQCDVCLQEYDTDAKHSCEGPGDRLESIETRLSSLERAVVALGEAATGIKGGRVLPDWRRNEEIEAAIRDLRGEKPKPAQ